MEKFQMYEADQQAETSKSEIATQNSEKISMEKIKKLQLILMAEQFFFYSAFFDFIDKYFINLKQDLDRDVENGILDESEDRTVARLNLWNRIFNVERKTFFGKTVEDWFDLSLWIGLIVAFVIFAAVGVYFFVRDYYFGQCLKVLQQST